MFVYQLTVVHQLLPPLEDNINKLVAELQGDKGHTSCDEICHDVRGLNNRKD